MKPVPPLLFSYVLTWRIKSIIFSTIQVWRCSINAMNIFNLHFAYSIANSAGAHSVTTISTNRIGSRCDVARYRFIGEIYISSTVDSSSSIFANLTRTGKNSTMKDRIVVQPSLPV